MKKNSNKKIGDRAKKMFKWIIVFHVGVFLAACVYAIFANETPSKEATNSLIVLIVICLIILYLLLRKPYKHKKESTYIPMYPNATPLSQPAKPTTNTTKSAPMSSMRSTYTTMQAKNDFRILNDSIQIILQTKNLETFFGRLSLVKEKALILREAELAGVPGICGTQPIVENLFSGEENQKKIILQASFNQAKEKADSLSTPKGKKSAWEKYLGQLQKYETEFSFEPLYTQIIENVQKEIDSLQTHDTVENTITYIESPNGYISRADGKAISDEEIPHLMQIGLERALEEERKRPKLSPKDDALVLNFTEKHSEESSKRCSKFEDLYIKATHESDTNKKIELLRQSIVEFENAKQWHYNFSKGGMLYFRETWEQFHNSKCSCFSWVQWPKNALEASLEELEWLERKENVVAWIIEHSKKGFVQTEIYRAFPDEDKGHLRKAITELASQSVIAKVKKGTSYYISSSPPTEEN